MIKAKKIPAHKKSVIDEMENDKQPGCIKAWLADVDELPPSKIEEYPGIVVFQEMGKEDLDLLSVMYSCPVYYIPVTTANDRNVPAIEEIVQFIKTRVEPHVRYPAVQPRRIRKVG